MVYFFKLILFSIIKIMNELNNIKLTDTYYNAIINKNKHCEDIDLYEFVQEIELINGITTKSYSRKEINYDTGDVIGRIVYNDPPLGPLPPGSECVNCENIGPLNGKDVYHEKDCIGPFKTQLVVSEEGLKKFDIIKKVENYVKKNFELNEQEKQLKQIFDNEIYITYLDIFPLRGMGNKKMYDEKGKDTLDNMVSLRYKIQNCNNLDMYTKEKNDFTVVINITNKCSILLISVPYECLPFDKFGKEIKDQVLGDLVDYDKKSSFVNVMRSNFNVFGSEGYELDLYKLSDIIKEKVVKDKIIIDGVKYSIYDIIYDNTQSTLRMKIIYKYIKFVIELRKRGSFRIISSYGSSEDIRYGAKYAVSKSGKPDMNKETLSKFIKVFYPIIFEQQNKILKEVFKKPPVNKVYNIIIPSDMKRNINPQPQVCNVKGRIRPYPYSFKGTCPIYTSSMTDEGLKYNVVRGTLKGYEYYEPCCKILTGSFHSNIKLNDFDKNSIEKLSDMIKEINNDYGNPDKYIYSSKGDKKKYLRRLIYGFPNELYTTRNEKDLEQLYDKDITEDSAERYGIKKENGKYIDNNSSTYKPGTQEIKRYGDGTMQRESRIFKGLKELIQTKGFIDKLINCYYKELSILKVVDITECDNSVKSMLLLTKCDKLDTEDLYYAKKEKGYEYVKLVITKFSFYIINIANNSLILNDNLDTPDSLVCKVITGFWTEDKFILVDLKTDGNYMKRRNELESLDLIIFETHFKTEMMDISEFSYEDMSKDFKKGHTNFLFINNDNLYNWFPNMDQYYMSRLDIRLKVEKNILKNLDDTDLDMLPNNSKLGLGKHDLIKIKDGGIYRFIIRYTVDNKGRKIIDKNKPFDIISDITKKGMYVQEKFDSSYIEKNIRALCIVFESINMVTYFKKL